MAQPAKLLNSGLRRQRQRAALRREPGFEHGQRAAPATGLTVGRLNSAIGGEPDHATGPNADQRRDNQKHSTRALNSIVTELRASKPEANAPRDRLLRSEASSKEDSVGHHANTMLASSSTAAQIDRTAAAATREAESPAQNLPAEQTVTPAGASPAANQATDDSAQDDSVKAATQKLIDDLRVMKRTRFNAQARFEAKHKASVAAFTLAAVFEIALSLAGTNFSGALPKNVASFIEFSSQFTAVFILGFGLVATLSNYQTNALYLQRCAMDWGSLSRELQIAKPVTRAQLQDYRRRYHEIEARCPPNHEAQDYRRATMNRDDPDAVRADKLDYFFDVYLIYALTSIGYLAFFCLGLWQALS